jgi:hypothetical protein
MNCPNPISSLIDYISVGKLSDDEQCILEGGSAGARTHTTTVQIRVVQFTLF